PRSTSRASARSPGSARLWRSSAPSRARASWLRPSSSCSRASISTRSSTRTARADGTRTARSAAGGGARGAPRSPDGGWLLAAVALVALACYANSLRGALLFDDVNAIVDNRLVRALDLRGIFLTPSWWGEPGRASYVPAYRPVTTLSFALNHALGGLGPLGYHAVNVLLHAAVCVLLSVVLGEVMRRPRLAGTAALLFAAHPVHTEAVASVVGGAEGLAALGGLGAGWLVLRARGAVRGRSVWVGSGGSALGAGVVGRQERDTVAT